VEKGKVRHVNYRLSVQQKYLIKLYVMFVIIIVCISFLGWASECSALVFMASLYAGAKLLGTIKLRIAYRT
jgi:hypothetical protein